MVEVRERGVAKWLATNHMGKTYAEHWHERPSIRSRHLSCKDCDYLPPSNLGFEVIDRWNLLDEYLSYWVLGKQEDMM